MEKVENPTAIRVKNSFSIENILSRPDNSEHQVRMMRQNPFQNNHVLFYGKPMNSSDIESIKSEEKCQNFDENSDNVDNDDHETNSEVASDDGNSSVHSKCQEITTRFRHFCATSRVELKLNLCRFFKRKMEPKIFESSTLIKSKINCN